MNIKLLTRGALSDFRKVGLVQALSKCNKEKKSIEWLMGALGLESPLLASSLLIRHADIQDRLRSARGRTSTMDKILFFERLGIARLELAENFQLMAMADVKLLDDYFHLANMGIPVHQICAPMMAEVAETGSLDPTSQRHFLEFLERIHPHRTNGEYLASSLGVPLRLVHDAAVSSPSMLVGGHLVGDLLARLKEAGMPAIDVLRRYDRISRMSKRVERRLDYLRENFDGAKVASLLRSCMIIQHEAYFWTDVSPPRGDDFSERLRRLTDWGQLPLDGLKNQTEFMERYIARSSPVRLAEASLALQSAGLTGEDVLRFPVLLTFKKTRIEKAAAAVRKTTGRETLDEMDIPILRNELVGVPRKHGPVPNFVYRELAESLECASSSVRDRCNENPWLKASFEDFIGRKKYSGVKELKGNVDHLRRLGFGARALSRCFFVALIPSDSVSRSLTQLMVDAESPMEMNDAEQDKILNLLQYRHETEFGCETEIDYETEIDMESEL